MSRILFEIRRGSLHVYFTVISNKIYLLLYTMTWLFDSYSQSALLGTIMFQKKNCMRKGIYSIHIHRTSLVY